MIQTKKNKKLKNFKTIIHEISMLKEFLNQYYFVKEIGLFGSYVKGLQNSKSDLDILVSFTKPIDLFTFISLKNYLTDQLSLNVDLVMKNSLKPALGKTILEETHYV